MKRLLLPLTLFLYSVAIAQPPNDTAQTFSPSQLQADWDTLYAQLQNNHPDLYAQWPQKEADAAFKKFRREFNRSLTRLEFDLIARRFVSRFQDGHTYVETDFNNPDFVNFGKRGGRLFPFRVAVIEGNIYCSDTSFTTAHIPLGAEIVSLNNHPSKEIILTLSSLFSADDKRTSYITTQRLFGYGLWLAFGWGQQTKVEFKYNGRKQITWVDGITAAEYRDLVFGKGSVRQLHLFPEQQLAVLQINSYSSPKAARAFIDSAFQVIKENGFKHIALDLRRNGGGNSVIGDMVLAYITR